MIETAESGVTKAFMMRRPKAVLKHEGVMSVTFSAHSVIKSAKFNRLIFIVHYKRIMLMFQSIVIPAVLVVLLIQLIVIRQLRWRWLSYTLPLIIALLLVAAGKVHLTYTGVEVGALGCLITRLDLFGYWKKKSNERQQTLPDKCS